MNLKKEIAIGFIVGLIANAIGTLLYVVLFSQVSIRATFEAAVEQGYIASLVSLGALLDLGAFFLFLRVRRDHRAKGVLLVTILIALGILFYKVF